MRLITTRRMAIRFSAVIWFTSLIVFSNPLFGQDLRTWSDNTGKFKVEAKFVKLEDGKVTLQKKDGKQITLQIGRLSDSDQEIAKDSGTPPSKPAAEEKKSVVSSSDELLKAIKINAKAIWDDQSFGDSPDLKIEVIAKGKPAAEAAHFGMLTVKSFVDQDGKEIKVGEEAFAMTDVTKEFTLVERPDNAFFAKHPKNAVQVNIFVDAENEVPSQIGKLVGEFKIRTAGIRKSIKIPNISSLEGNEVTNPIAKEFGLTIEVKLKKKGNRQNLKVTANGEVDHVLNIKVVGRNGKQPDNQEGWSHSVVGSIFTQSYDFNGDIPDDAILQIDVAKDLVEVVIPFEFESIKIPKKK